MKAPARPGLLLVATREWRFLRRDEAALILLILVPTIAFAVLTLTFSNAVIRNLRVVVVDADRSATSLVYVQAIDAAPGVSVAERADDMTGAMRAIRSGDAIAAVYIPPNFERDLLGRERPQIVTLYNRQYYTPGNNANSAISKAISAATATLPKGAGGGGWRPGALSVESYVLSNPALNYAQFLLRAVLPTVLHVVVAIAGAYVVGSEFSRRRSFRTWMAAAGGRPLVALIGKLLPLFGVFVVLMVVVALILDGLFHVAFRGDPLLVAAAAALDLVAYLGLGALLVLLTRNLASGLSLTAIVCNPAFGFAGVGFPVIAMNGFARVWGSILPLRWYLQVLFDQAARGVPPADSVPSFLALAGLACGFFALAWLRLRAIAGKPTRSAAASPPPLRDGRGLALAMRNETLRILSDRSVLGMFVIAPIVYGILYPQPYLGEVLRRVPIAVVDQDDTELSRAFVQALDAHQTLAVAARPTTLAEAQRALDRHDVYAVVAIPKDSEGQALRGQQARSAVYVDAAYFLLYSQTLQSVAEAAATASSDLALRGARPDGSLAYASIVKNSPVEQVSEPLFNPTGGYAAYVVPAAFVLILQQTILMGVASIGGAAYEDGGARSRQLRSGPRAVLGQGLVHLAFALPGVALFLVVLPRVYGFPISS